ncbi:MAG: hypothetical protein J7K47_02020 [Thermoplasmata archaeon]|nr:hypothetical protein [Thermoplasmata archaeon]
MWDKEKKVLLPVSVIEWINGEVYRIMFYSQRGFMLSFSGNKLQRFILMQYTGLKDKNGKEIYEGDIVKIYDEDFDGNIEIIKIAKVVFKNASFFLEPALDEGSFIYTLSAELEYWDIGGCEIEVIGNIYENKELLKEVQNAKNAC